MDFHTKIRYINGDFMTFLTKRGFAKISFMRQSTDHDIGIHGISFHDGDGDVVWIMKNNGDTTNNMVISESGRAKRGIHKLGSLSGEIMG